jgi:hypothetical protein
MASNHRKSRKQFRTPLGRWIGDAGHYLPRRTAKCPDVEEPFKGRAVRTKLTGQGLTATPRVRRSRVATCPEVEEPFRGGVCRHKHYPPNPPPVAGGLAKRRSPAPTWRIPSPEGSFATGRRTRA